MKRFAPFRFAFDLSRPIEIDGVSVSTLWLRAADVDDAALLPVDRLCGCNHDLSARWIALLGDVPETSARAIAPADLDRVTDLLNELVGTLREAIIPGWPRFHAGFELSAPITTADGAVLTRLPMRRPLLSDYEALAWNGSLETYTRGPRGIDLATDWGLVTRWAARLGAVEVEDIEQLPLRDASRLLDEVATAVRSFESLLIASS